MESYALFRMFNLGHGQNVCTVSDTLVMVTVQTYVRKGLVKMHSLKWSSTEMLRSITNRITAAINYWLV